MIAGPEAGGFITVADQAKNRLNAGPVPAGTSRSVNSSFVEPKRKAKP